MIGSLTEMQAMELLKKSTLGRIGCTDGNETYIIPVSYLLDGNSIIAHSKPGRKITMMRNNPEVCFEVDHIKSFNTWKTVIVWGKYEEIKDESEKCKIMHAFARRMIYLKENQMVEDPETSAMRLQPEPDLKTVVYKISLRKITGRYERHDRDELY